MHIVSLANTVRYKWAVMVEALHTGITLPTVNGSLRSHDHAGEADFQPGYERFLAIKAIDNQVILKVSPEPQRVLIIRLFWDQAWI